MTGGPRIYLDHNASTPVDPRVLGRLVSAERRAPGNPASLHATGRAARAVLEEAREEVAAASGRSPEEVVFVSGGTEADNLAVLTLGDPSRPVLCAPVEHPAVWEPAGRRGRVELEVDARGFARLAAPAEPFGLVCLVHAQSEVGTVQPVTAAAELARANGVPLHVDAAQSVGRLPMAEVFAAADTVAISCHKFGGLRGGGIVVGPGVPGLSPLLRGGGQERGLRAGTQSPAMASANALAFALAVAEREERAARMCAAREAFVGALAERGVVIVTPLAAEVLPNTVMIEFDVADGRRLLPALDRAGLEASHGSACSSGSPAPPRVLLAMGMSDERARRCVRFSFSHETPIDVAREAAQRVCGVVARLRDA